MQDLDKYFYLSQRLWINDDAPLKIAVKSRQVGFSCANSIRRLPCDVEHGLLERRAQDLGGFAC